MRADTFNYSDDAGLDEAKPRGGLIAGEFVTRATRRPLASFGRCMLATIAMVRSAKQIDLTVRLAALRQTKVVLIQHRRHWIKN